MRCKTCAKFLSSCVRCASVTLLYTFRSGCAASAANVHCNTVVLSVAVVDFTKQLLNCSTVVLAVATWTEPHNAATKKA